MDEAQASRGRNAEISAAKEIARRTSMGNAQVHNKKTMTKLTYLNEVEAEMLSGGFFSLAAFNDTLTNIGGIRQSSNQFNFSGLSAVAGNLSTQAAVLTQGNLNA
jgi:hypothetical protein